SRIGYVGWSAGGRLGAIVAASEPRVRGFVLLSAGAAPVPSYVATAPRVLRAQLERVLRSIDPIGYVARAKPGSLLLENGRRDSVVPRAALMNIVRAAPHGTIVRWYAASHGLNRKAYRDAYAWPRHAPSPRSRRLGSGNDVRDRRRPRRPPASCRSGTVSGQANSRWLGNLPDRPRPRIHPDHAGPIPVGEDVRRGRATSSPP